MSRTIILLVALALFSTTTFSIELNCDGENEEYHHCGSACQTTCGTLGLPCPIVNVRCNDACYCKEGYARFSGDNDSCIPINECPGNRRG